MDKLTQAAISATLHCLMGCAIGEVLGMVIGTALNWHNAAVTVLSIILAFVFGYGLTARAVVAHGQTLRKALSVAFASDTVSIASMELIDTMFIWLVPGAVHATLTQGLFWWSLFASLIVAFMLTVPVNRWLIAQGKGHAVVHDMHGHEHHH